MKYLILLLTLTMSFGQTKLETRIFTSDLISDNDIINLSNLTEYDLDYYILKFISIEHNYEGNYPTNAWLEPENENGRIIIRVELNENQPLFWTLYPSEQLYHNSQGNLKYRGPNNSIVKLAITAEFPQDETPYTQADIDNAYYDGAQSGDISGDGTLNVMDLVQYIEKILTF